MSKPLVLVTTSAEEMEVSMDEYEAEENGRKGGRGRGECDQGGHGGYIGAYENGIDISDVTRSFEDIEWD